jgi:8-oxo-dGTP pyrophosphatase MutT (NUDIX family)
LNRDAAGRFSGADLVERARTRLTFDLPAGLLEGRIAARGGDHIIDGGERFLLKAPAKPAAVLIPVVDHAREATVLLTQRVETLRAHSGQIAFPGGRIDPEDGTPAQAALREAWEEIGLEARHVTPLGYLEPYLTGTGYLVVPTVALVTPPLHLTLNPTEVHDAFEVPLSFLMEPGNHQRQSRSFGGTLRSFYAMPYAERYIWGITAGILRGLYERLYGDAAVDG